MKKVKLPKNYRYVYFHFFIKCFPRIFLKAVCRRLLVHRSNKPSAVIYLKICVDSTRENVGDFRCECQHTQTTSAIDLFTSRIDYHNHNQSYWAVRQVLSTGLQNSPFFPLFPLLIDFLSDLIALRGHSYAHTVPVLQTCFFFF